MTSNIKFLVVIAVAIGLTLVSSAMTILGYNSLYAGRTIVISSLFVVLEFAKATIFGIVLVYAEKKHKHILLALAGILIILSFVGHLSYLSKSYHSNKVSVQTTQELTAQTRDAHTTQLADIESQITMLQEQINAGKAEIETLTSAAEGFDNANSRHWAVSTSKSRIKEIQTQNAQTNQQIMELYTRKAELLNKSLDTTREAHQTLTNTTDRSVFQYTADMFGITQDRLASIINFLLALVIDTLALTMLWTAGTMWRQRKRYTKRMKQVKPTEDVIQPTKLPDENYEQYLFEGHTIQDVTKLSDEEIQVLKSRVKTQAQLNWLNFALSVRKDLNGDLKYNELE